MDATPDTHILVLGVHFRDVVEPPLQIGVEEIGRREWDGRLGPKHGFEDSDGYSGCIGVSFNGVQVGSRSVASLPSMSPLRIAVTGRQKL